MKIPMLALAALSVALMAPAYAGNDGNLTGLIKPGLWKSTATTSINGKTTTRTHKKCVTQDQVAHFRDSLKKAMNKAGGTAKIKTFERDGKNLHLVVVISAGLVNANMDTHYVFTTPTSYHGKTHMTVTGGRKMTRDVKIKAHRVGQCTKTDNGTQGSNK